MAELKLTVSDPDQLNRIYAAVLGSGLPSVTPENPLGSTNILLAAYLLDLVSKYERRQAIQNLPPFSGLDIIPDSGNPGGG